MECCRCWEHGQVNAPSWNLFRDNPSASFRFGRDPHLASVKQGGGLEWSGLDSLWPERQYRQQINLGNLTEKSWGRRAADMRLWQPGMMALIEVYDRMERRLEQASEEIGTALSLA
jgi:hypothetical protein